MLCATRAARVPGWCRWKQVKGAVCRICALELEPRNFLFLFFRFRFTTLAGGELLVSEKNVYIYTCVSTSLGVCY